MNIVLEAFRKMGINKIKEETFIKGLMDMHNDYKHIYPTMDDVLKTYKVEDLVDIVVEKTCIPENLKFKLFKFNNSKNCCMAPYSTINFDTMGYIRVCCYNSDFILGEYPKISIKDAWNSEQRNIFINSLTNKIFPKGC